MANNNKPLNLEDIARRAGVSRSTVSRVVNNQQYVSKATRERVMAVVDQFGFSPNPAARALVTQLTRTIGVAIPHSLNTVFEDAIYFPTLLQGISQTVNQRDYVLVLWLGQQDEDEERFYERILKNRLIDGLIIASATVSAQKSLINHLLKVNLPFVLVERPLYHEDEVSYVSVDNVQAAQNIVNHLLNQGRQRIGTIAGALDNPDGIDRLKGYKLALEGAGIAYDESLVVEGHFKQRSGYLGMKALLDKNIDAVFVASDSTAVGAMQALEEARIRVPDDLALVGFDDLPYAIQTTPQLTTMRHPILSKGAQATSLLLDLIEGITEGPQQRLLPTQLIIRESCGAAQNLM